MPWWWPWSRIDEVPQQGVRADRGASQAARAHQGASQTSDARGTPATRWARTATVLCWGSPVLGGLALTLYALQAEGWRAGLSVAGTALALAAAATAGGGLLGFLFGIPRTLQHTPAQATKPAPTERGEEQAEERKQAEEPKDEAQPGLEYGANTNLEEISDWLTKILVGVGLTQIAGVRPALASYAKSVAPALGGFDGAGTFAVAWLLYFAACGFLMGYVATRLHFAPALRHADVETRLERLTSVTEQSQAELARVTTKVSELEDQAQRDAQALALVQRQLEPGTDATPISDATTGTSESANRGWSGPSLSSAP
jgi:hypothetical protein